MVGANKEAVWSGTSLTCGSQCRPCVPARASSPGALSIEHLEFVKHALGSHCAHLLLVTGQVPEHAVNGRNLETSTALWSSEGSKHGWKKKPWKTHSRASDRLTMCIKETCLRSVTSTPVGTDDGYAWHAAVSAFSFLHLIHFTFHSFSLL